MATRERTDAMRLGIIGCGEVVVRGHLPTLRRMSAIEVAALADTSDEQLAVAADTAGVPLDRRFRDHHDLLKVEGLDAVLVATPPGIRREILRDVGEAGLVAIAEKPLATNLTVADAIVATAADRGDRIIMCHNYAFFPEFRWLTEVVRDGAIGEVRTVVFQGLGASPWPGAASYRPGWRNEPVIGGGGRFMDTGLHALYLMEGLFGGPPASVWSDAFFDDPDVAVETRCFVHFRYPQGLGVVNIGMGQGPVSVDVVGTAGRAHLAYPPTASDLAHPPETGYVVRDNEVVIEKRLATRGMFTEEFYDYLRGRAAGADDAYEHSARHGRHLIELVLAAYASARSGERVDLPLSPDESLYGEGIAGWVGRS
jgi:predicted dehydrogenase